MKTQSPSTTRERKNGNNCDTKGIGNRSRGSILPIIINGAVLVLMIGAALYVSSAVSASRKTSPVASRAKSAANVKSMLQPVRPMADMSFKGTAANPFALQQPPPTPTPEAIATYEVTGSMASPVCTNNPKTNFNLGDRVCARATNAPLSSPSALRRFNWGDTKGIIEQSQDVLTDPDTNIFTLPADNTSTIDGQQIDNRGTWAVSLNSTLENTTRAIAYFTVSDTANPAADLALYNFTATDEVVSAGDPTSFLLWLSNIGPDAASNVHVTMAVPTNLSYSGASTTSGFTCAQAGSLIDCSVASWASGAVDTITLNFLVSNLAPNGIISTTATINSDTFDPFATSDDPSSPNGNNASTASIEVRSPGAPPATCVLGCPGNITATANTSQNNVSGAFVTFGDGVEVSGDCGTVSFSPASGSFFAVGTTPVNVTSSTGGGSCSFTVTVLDTPAPTISCPPDQSAEAPSGSGVATVSVGDPTATGTGVSVSGVRSDSQDISDPYPIGTTTITWTATDSSQRTASCVQHITVTSADAPTITCPSNKSFDAGGDCRKTLTADQIGTPTAGPSTGPYVPSVTATRSDNLALTDPYPAGNTTITWTAANALGQVSCTQTITITTSGDTTPPTLVVPPDVSVTTSTCSALVDDELGTATATDNCSTVSIVRTGVPTVPCPIPGNPNRTCETFVFPVGTTNVTYTATDAAGNTATGVQHVTVHEITPPTFTFVPANLTINTGPGATECGTVVGDATLGAATVADNCDTTVLRTGVPVGNDFPVGVTVITYTAKADLSVTATQTVTIVDNTPPIVTAPGPVTLYTGPGATSCGVTVSNLDATLGTGSATDNCPGVGAVTRSGVPAGNNFPVGDTTITYSATDAYGNSSSATQTVTVIDNTPPTISCPVSFTLEPTCPSGAVGNYTAPVGTDNCPGAVTTRTAGLVSGSVFPIGNNTVTYSVTDAHGNGPVSCSFTVTVLTSQNVIQNLIDGVNASSLDPTSKGGLIAKLTAALDAINQGKTNVACNKLDAFNSSVQNLISHGNITATQGQAWINSSNHVRNTIGCTNLGCS